MENQLPLGIKPVTDKENEILKKYYKGYDKPFLRFGPQGYLCAPGYGEHASDIYNLEVRPDDIWVTTFSRSGTTWLQELVWLVANDLDFEKARAIPVTKRYAFIDPESGICARYDYRLANYHIVGRNIQGEMWVSWHLCLPLLGYRHEFRFPTQASGIPKTNAIHTSHRATYEDFRTLPTLTSPRFVKTHLPLSRLPPKLVDTAKVFYIARDVRDVAVSFHFAHKLFGYFEGDVSFKEFWFLFKNNLILHTPIFPHINEAWQRRNHPNLLFLFYEEMQKDLPGVIDRVCNFLNREYTAEQKEELCRHLSFGNMKKNSPLIKSTKDNNTFFRKGKSGSWVEHFDEAMRQEADEYIQENLKNTDMQFPTINRTDIN